MATLRRSYYKHKHIINITPLNEQYTGQQSVMRIRIRTDPDRIWLGLLKIIYRRQI